MATEIISREEARAQGLKRFYTGVPCRNGHLAERLVSNGFCRDCRTAVQAKNYQLNKDGRAAYRAELRERNPTYFADFYRRNSDKRKEETRRWYAGNKEHHASVVKEWRERNPDKVREIGRLSRRNRRARIAQVGGSHTQADLERIYERQAGKCALCKCSLAKTKAEVDHIVPLARGGHNGPSNLQYLCRPCNRAKSAKDPVQFAQERGLLL